MGVHAEQETIDVDGEAPPAVTHTQHGEAGASKGKREHQAMGKRKRGMSEEEGVYLVGLTDAINEFFEAVTDANTPKVAPGIYSDVMSCPNFSRGLSCCDRCMYLMKEKETAMGLMYMDAPDKELRLKDYLCRNNLWLKAS